MRKTCGRVAASVCNSLPVRVLWSAMQYGVCGFALGAAALHGVQNYLNRDDAFQACDTTNATVSDYMDCNESRAQSQHDKDNDNALSAGIAALAGGGLGIIYGAYKECKKSSAQSKQINLQSNEDFYTPIDGFGN